MLTMIYLKKMEASLLNFANLCYLDHAEVTPKIFWIAFSSAGVNLSLILISPDALGCIPSLRSAVV